jgi:ferritin-like metal-binding protein YciE
MKLSNLKKLLVHELRDLHSAETQILDALPRLIEKSRDEDLRTAFQEHLEETRRHVTRLNEIFAEFGEEPDDQHCRGMEGLLQESDQMLKEDADADVRDAGIISAVQRVEHYEMAGYGSAATYARMLDERHAAELLEQTLDEEKRADKTLTLIAERTVNPKAKSASA